MSQIVKHFITRLYHEVIEFVLQPIGHTDGLLTFHLPMYFPQVIDEGFQRSIVLCIVFTMLGDGGTNPTVGNGSQCQSAERAINSVVTHVECQLVKRC